ncbi:MAG: uridine diphosphate-N-acetylglucosamine-binding protein YvcK [Actinomycetota bacterium]|nr:uridine diphosphate-N-acetylglucosamine-binding protein YvcK [Actinomycetota bacterium]
MRLEEIAPSYVASPQRILAIGGGHGLAATLSALSRIGHFPIGIVSVADDGGSSGRLREAFGQIPPGDIRRCISALADPSSSWASILEYRFSQTELRGHALGNLILTALMAIGTTPVEACVELSRLAFANGLILPASNEPITLIGHYGEMEIVGQAMVASTAGLDAVALMPPDPEVPDVVIEAITGASTITIGPGSIHTSIGAVIGIPKIQRAIVSSGAKVIYIANLSPQAGEAQDMSVADHFAEIGRFGFEVDQVLYDDTAIELGVVDRSKCEWTFAHLSGDEKRIHDISLLSEALYKIIG